MNLKDISVTIAAPVRNRGEYLEEYLNCIYNQTIDKKNTILHFLLNDSTDNSKEILWSFKNKHNNEYRRIIIDTWNRGAIEDARVTHVRREIFSHLAELRNNLIRKNKTDFWVSIDTDIMTKPDTVEKLILHDKDIVAGLIINGYLVEPNNAERFPNILNKSGRAYKHIDNWRELEKNGNTLIQVDFTGAIMAVKLHVTKNTKVKWGFGEQGEDEIFCENAKKEGYEIFCDLTAKSTHCMNKEYLLKYKSGSFIFE